MYYTYVPMYGIWQSLLQISVTKCTGARRISGVLYFIIHIYIRRREAKKLISTKAAGGCQQNNKCYCTKRPVCSRFLRTNKIYTVRFDDEKNNKTFG